MTKALTVIPRRPRVLEAFLRIWRRDWMAAKGGGRVLLTPAVIYLPERWT